MDLKELVLRLVDNPYDEQALFAAQQIGNADPKGYAELLQSVADQTNSDVYAAHWLVESADAWALTLGAGDKAMMLYRQAAKRDPFNAAALEKIMTAFREKGDTQGILAFLEERLELLNARPMDPTVASELAALHEELGGIYMSAEPQDFDRALYHFRDSMNYEPYGVYAIFNAREILKGRGEWAEAAKLYAPELAVETDPSRRILLLNDEADVLRQAGDLIGVTRALRAACELDPQDPSLVQAYVSSIFERMQAGHVVPDEERSQAVQVLLGMAKNLGAESGLDYTIASLDLLPGNDAAMESFLSYARALGDNEAIVLERFKAYVEAHPQGRFSYEARALLKKEEETQNASEFPSGEATVIGSQVLDSPSLQSEIREARSRFQQQRKEPTNPIKVMTQHQGDAPTRVFDLSSELGSVAGFSPKSNVVAGPEIPPKEPESSMEKEERRSPSPLVGHEKWVSKVEKLERAHRPLAPDTKNLVGNLSSKEFGRNRITEILNEASEHVLKGDKEEAYKAYSRVLESDPIHPEALSWVEDYLRKKREYGALRDVILASVREGRDSIDSRKGRLREVAGLCEGQLRDADGAMKAWRQILAMDRTDEGAKVALARLFERFQRWDDLANLIEQEATIEVDMETKIGLEKKLAKLHQEKRQDLIGAADAWSRIASFTPEDEGPVETAVNLYEQAKRYDLASRFIAERLPLVSEDLSRGYLAERWAVLNEKLEQKEVAADAYALAGRLLQSAKAWEKAESRYIELELWSKAAEASFERALLSESTAEKAKYLDRSGRARDRAGEIEKAISAFEEASKLDPSNDEYASTLLAKYTQKNDIFPMISFLKERASVLDDVEKRIAARKQAASLAKHKLDDLVLARELWSLVLNDRADAEVLESLVSDALHRGEPAEAASFLRRLADATTDATAKSEIVLREAQLLQENVQDLDAARLRYEEVLVYEPEHLEAIRRLAFLYEKKGLQKEAAEQREKELRLVSLPSEKAEIARMLANLYEGTQDLIHAVSALDKVREFAPEDVSVLPKLSELVEKLGDWKRMASLLGERIEIEKDQAKEIEMTLRRSIIFSEKIGDGEEALAVLCPLADRGVEKVRAAYIELGDALGKQAWVAEKIRSWWIGAPPSENRSKYLRGAFHRFESHSRPSDALNLGKTLLKQTAADAVVAKALEVLAVDAKDAEGVSYAHAFLATGLSGQARAEELVRQAEAMIKAGIDVDLALRRGEEGLSDADGREDVEKLLVRLSAIAGSAEKIIALYENQVSRSTSPETKVADLARAAQVAAEHNDTKRSTQFYELALLDFSDEDMLVRLEASAAAGDSKTSSVALRKSLASALSNAGHGMQDRGRSRALFLRHAANIAARDLSDGEQAYEWFTESLVAYVEDETLDQLEAFALRSSEAIRVDQVLSRSLESVFDAASVKALLARRAFWRRSQLNDKMGSVVDLRKLHELNPSDANIVGDITRVLEELGDARGLVDLLEEQILRTRDIDQRASMAQKVAKIWESELNDFREAADAWRRVLRLRPKDAEAQAGLERSKSKIVRRQSASVESESTLEPIDISLGPSPNIAGSGFHSPAPSPSLTAQINPTPTGGELPLVVKSPLTEVSSSAGEKRPKIPDPSLAHDEREDRLSLAKNSAPSFDFDVDDADQEIERSLAKLDRGSRHSLLQPDEAKRSPVGSPSSTGSGTEKLQRDGEFSEIEIDEIDEIDVEDLET